MQNRPTLDLWCGQASEKPLVGDSTGFWEWLKEKNTQKEKVLDNNLYLEIPLPPRPIRTEDSSSETRDNAGDSSRVSFEVEINYTND